VHGNYDPLKNPFWPVTGCQMLRSSLGCAKLVGDLQIEASHYQARIRNTAGVTNSLGLIVLPCTEYSISRALAPQVCTICAISIELGTLSRCSK
jgi:hypothetical protein